MTKEEYLELENIKREARYEKWRAFKKKANDSIKNTFHGEVNQAFSSVANNRDNEVD